MIIEVGKKYMIIYDDHGRMPVKKVGKVISKDDTIFSLDSKPREGLNTRDIIRIEEIK